MAEAYAQFFSGKADVLGNSLVQQAVSGIVLKATREFVASGKAVNADKAALFQSALEQGRDNLLRAWKAGVPLVMGTDAGNPLVFHGPSLHHELQLWVQAGIPPAVVLEAATRNAAKLLRASQPHRHHPQGPGRQPAAGGRQSLAGHLRHGADLAGGFRRRAAAARRAVREEIGFQLGVEVRSKWSTTRYSTGALARSSRRPSFSTDLKMETPEGVEASSGVPARLASCL